MNNILFCCAAAAALVLVVLPSSNSAQTTLPLNTTAAGAVTAPVKFDASTIDVLANKIAQVLDASSGARRIHPLTPPERAPSGNKRRRLTIVGPASPFSSGGIIGEAPTADTATTCRQCEAACGMQCMEDAKAGTCLSTCITPCIARLSVIDAKRCQRSVPSETCNICINANAAARLHDMKAANLTAANSTMTTITMVSIGNDTGLAPEIMIANGQQRRRMANKLIRVPLQILREQLRMKSEVARFQRQAARERQQDFNTCVRTQFAQSFALQRECQIINQRVFLSRNLQRFFTVGGVGTTRRIKMSLLGRSRLLSSDSSLKARNHLGVPHTNVTAAVNTLTF